MNPVEIRGQPLVRLRRKLVSVAAAIMVAVVTMAGIGTVALAQPMPSSGDSSVAAVPPAAHPDMSRVQATEIFSESFEGVSVNQWVLTGHAGGPRWNLITNTQHAGPYLHLAHSTVRAMWFGDPATGLYGTAGGDVPPDKDPVFSGTLTHNTPIAIPAGDTWAFLTFWSWEYTEMSQLVSGLKEICFGQPTCQFDVRQVWISGTNDITWTLKWSTDVNGTIELAWHRVAIDVSDYIGESVRVRFAFTTDPLGQDGRSNNARGWYVDDVTIFTFTPSEFIYLPIIARNH
jgi:hypothetical protein